MQNIFVCKLVTARLLGAFCARQPDAYFNKAAILQYGDYHAILNCCKLKFNKAAIFQYGN